MTGSSRALARLPSLPATDLCSPVHVRAHLSLLRTIVPRLITSDRSCCFFTVHAGRDARRSRVLADLAVFSRTKRDKEGSAKRDTIRKVELCSRRSCKSYCKSECPAAIAELVTQPARSTTRSLPPCPKNYARAYSRSIVRRTRVKTKWTRRDHTRPPFYLPMVDTRSAGQRACESIATRFCNVFNSTVTDKPALSQI